MPRRLMVAGRTLQQQRHLVLADVMPTLVQDMRVSATAPEPAYVTVAPSAVANTKGSWVELIAATTAHADVVSLLMLTTALSGNNGGAIADLGIGDAGGEVVIAPDILVGNILAAPAGRGVTLPVEIPKGSRVAVRWQSARTSAASATVAVNLYEFPHPLMHSPAKLESIGANTATSLGVNVGTTSNVWTEITAAAAHAYQGFVAGLASADTGTAAGTFAVDVGVGASGAERSTNGDCAFSSSTTEAWNVYPGSLFGFVPLHCPAGSRVAVRVRDSQQSTNNPTVALLGVPYA